MWKGKENKHLSCSVIYIQLRSLEANLWWWCHTAIVLLFLALFFHIVNEFNDSKEILLNVDLEFI